MDGCGSDSRPCKYAVHALIEIKFLDLLIRNSQVAAISADIQHTGNWAEVPLVRTLFYLNQMCTLAQRFLCLGHIY